MTMTDLLPLETWTELEHEIHEEYGLNAAATDATGFRLSDWKNWANTICPMIKSVPAATSAICSIANQTILALLKSTHKPVIEECDAGLCKISVPVFQGGELIGTVGGCGVLLDDSELEEFLIMKTTGRSEQEVAAAATTVKRISHARADGFAAWLEGRVADLMREEGIPV